MKNASPKDVMKFRADPVLRRAIRLRAAMEDLDQQDVIVAALRRELADEIRQVEEHGVGKVDTPGEGRQKSPGRRKKEESP